MSATEKKLPPDGGDKTAVDISRLSSGRLHPVRDECLGHEEESVYDYDIPEDVRGYEKDGSVHDKPQEAHGNKASGEDESFAYKAKARVIGLWTRLTSSTVIVPAVGCGIVVIASAVAAIILATHLNLVKTEDALGSMMQEDMMISATQQKLDPSFLTALFDENHTASLEWLEPFENISLNSKTLPVTVTSLPTTDLNECTWKPCLHGRCVNKDGGYKCTCNPGWTGQNCQQDLNECDGKPCKHGRCVNKDGGYKCTCNPGWTGHNCQQDLNECTGNPCQHGRCVNKDGGFKCTCNPGWTGQNCQQDLNECTRDPCQHGRCVNKDGGYKCACYPGWTGQNCQQDLNECTRNPCLHGRCVNKDGGYNCACNPGWTGHSCHLAKPCPVGWRGYKNHCYKLMRDKVKWDKAKKRCDQLGANLASITSYGEANFVNNIITGAPVGKWGIHLVWFGLHRNDGFRKFTDGSQVYYKNWEPGQPNNKRDIWAGQNCVGMYSKRISAECRCGPARGSEARCRTDALFDNYCS
ncbi:hypothetical protein Bbelb_155150 [Branchiostoma belcheri]|nr:hypothetical protein Bbelb_155150 [Branchiostoma belcheri]